MFDNSFLKSQIHECNKCRLAVMLAGYKLTVFCIFMDFLPNNIYIGVNRFDAML